MADADARVQKLDFRKVIDTALEAVNTNRNTFFLFALGIYGIPAALMQYVALLVQGDPSLSGLLSPIVILAIATGSIGQIGLMIGAQAAFDRKRMSFGEMFSAALKVLLPYIGLVICMVFAIFLAGLLLVVPGVMLAVAWAPAPAVLIFERKRVFESFGRAAFLTKGNRWNVLILFGIYIVIVLIVSIALGFAIGFPLRLIGGLTIGNAIANGFASAIGLLISGPGSAALYQELRIAKEGGAPGTVASVFE